VITPKVWFLLIVAGFFQCQKILVQTFDDSNQIPLGWSSACNKIVEANRFAMDGSVVV
jgi:hypothetical protein